MKRCLTLKELRFVSCVLTLSFLCFAQPANADSDTQACINMVGAGLREVGDDPSRRFLGKVAEDTARCRGGDEAVKYRSTPWVDWSNYYATGDNSSKHEGDKAKTRLGEHIYPDGRGIDGALMDLEYQRIELIKFNLFDQSTYEQFIKYPARSASMEWEAMKLPSSHPEYDAVGGKGRQICKGDLITHRTLTGICNDLVNPLMGSSGMPFARNAKFEETFPSIG